MFHLLKAIKINLGRVDGSVAQLCSLKRSAWEYKVSYIWLETVNIYKRFVVISNVSSGSVLGDSAVTLKLYLVQNFRPNTTTVSFMLCVIFMKQKFKAGLKMTLCIE